ncbi:MAG: hypothetical protein FJY95_11455 [Candidatus Handelsmanbacteria bacterium]|nr:hypothetical protein [Candidatus Handelsmanbacteria bacterium]
MAGMGRAAILDHVKRQITIAEVPVLDPGTGEVLVRQSMCVFCGTDVHMF